MIETDPTTRIAVLLFTDIADSVDMQQRLGTQAYTEILRQHDQLFREALAPILDSQLSKDMGDGWLAEFSTAADGVNAALRFQMLLDKADWPQEAPSVRIGLHQGQVTEIEASEDAPDKVVGMPINLAARIMGLAKPGQILLTRPIFDDARQFVRRHPEVDIVDELPAIEWRAHGKYLFKGADEPMDVFEVGADGLAPFSPPPDSEKAIRSITPEEETTLGWRPGIGLEIPHRNGWVLEEKLGTGGFGEVWLASRQKINDRRVFKFCFDIDRLRSFKRELTLFRLIREALGDRPDITAIHEINLESPPYFLELEYVEAGDLKKWAHSEGGIGMVGLKARLEIVAQVAEALAETSSEKPEDTNLALKVATLQVWFGMDVEHTTTSRQMLTWGAETPEANAAERVARLASLRPIENEEIREAALDLARNAVELAMEKDGLLPWAQMTLGMAEYRNGRYEEASEALMGVAGSVSDKTWRPEFPTGTADFYRAMCLFQQRRPDEARSLFTATRAKMDHLPRDEIIPTTHQDDLVLWLAAREAAALLELPLRRAPPRGVE